MIHQMIEDTLLSIGGCTPNLLGFRYIVDSVELAVERPQAVLKITKDIYPVVAERYGSTSSRVERAIRCAIDNIYLDGDADILTKALGNIAKMKSGKPTNSAFIAAFAVKIRRGISR